MPNSESDHTALPETNDQAPYGHQYGHGRMPVFMKLLWIGYLVLGTWYVATFLLDAVGQELGK